MCVLLLIWVTNKWTSTNASERNGVRLGSERKGKEREGKRRKGNERKIIKWCKKYSWPERKRRERNKAIRASWTDVCHDQPSMRAQIQ